MSASRLSSRRAVRRTGARYDLQRLCLRQRPCGVRDGADGGVGRGFVAQRRFAAARAATQRGGRHGRRRPRLVRTRLTDMGRFRWTEGLICLNDVPFGELLERFSDYYDIRILLKIPNSTTCAVRASSVRATASTTRCMCCSASLTSVTRTTKSGIRSKSDKRRLPDGGT